MKKQSSPQPTDIGRRYWRSLDQLADTPEFQQWLQDEFPQGASEWNNDFNRRDFVKLMSASFLLAGFGLTGCRRPEEHIVPFSTKPENYTHGVPQLYATAMPDRNAAVPLLARSNDGRPTKLDGNVDHPAQAGGTSAYAQAAILNLYDPDRAIHFRRDGRKTSRRQALDYLQSTATELAEKQGEGLGILLESSSSPSRERLVSNLKQKLPQAQISVYEPLALDQEQRACERLTGQRVQAEYQLDKAQVILSLDADFLGSEREQNRFTRDFARGRKVQKPGDAMNRLYAVEGLMSLTGANADHRLRVAPSAVVKIAAQIAADVMIRSGQADHPLLASLRSLGWVEGVNPNWISECAADLVAHRGQVAVLAGYRQPLMVHALAQVINQALEAIGTTVQYRTLPSPSKDVSDLGALVEALNNGKVQTLVLVGTNPAYNAPADLAWAEAAAKAERILRWGYYEDESSIDCAYHFPGTHFLESWGDVRTSDGTLTPIQPLIQPLFEGLSELEFLARLAGQENPSSHDLVRETFASFPGGSSKEASWKQFLHDGFLAGSAAPVVPVELKFDQIRGELESTQAKTPSSEALEVVFHRDASVDDGRYANNGWLQELPDPITKMTWGNAVVMSRQTAQDLRLKNHQMVEVELEGRTISGPVWIQPGMANSVLSLALGYGRRKAGRVGGQDGQTVGFNAFALRAQSAPFIASGARVRATRERQDLVCTQDHWSMQGRAIVREANLAQFEQKPDFAHHMDLEAHTDHVPKDPETGQPKGIYQHPYEAHPVLKSEMHQWGMVIDLNSCTGCSACVVACQSENNIPIVGKDQVSRSREMHWLRIDRYYAGDPELYPDRDPTDSDASQAYQEWIDDPQVVHQPMMCQHCESAPCESVCPVNATVHDAEGLNVMAYNRCVGTRYCSNNCPYKVRRFNFFDYNKRPLDALYKGPLASKSEIELDLVKLIKNPDVTVRMRGVMEKCTFCVQRIEQAKIARKVQARDTGDVEVPDGTIRTACEQSCPAEAIVFGNVADPESRVSQLKKQQRNYSVLGFLDVRPRITYLAKVRNPNPAMPDFYDMPLSLKEYSRKMGDPMSDAHGAETHGTEHHPNEAAHHPAEPKGGH